MNVNETNKPKWKCIITIFLTTIGVYLGFKYLLPLILPFLIAYFLSWIIRPSTEFLYRRFKFPRALGGFLSLIILLATVGTGLYFLLNVLTKQAIEFMRNVPIYLDIISRKLDRWCQFGDRFFRLEGGTAREIMDDNLSEMVQGIKSTIMPQLTHFTLNALLVIVGGIGIILIILISSVLMVQDLPYYREKYRNIVIYKDLRKVTDKLTDVGMAYIRTQLTIMAVVAVICVIGLSIIKNEYALLLGIGIAILDALPILGSGMILIPWGIIQLINGNILAAAVLLTIFLLCQIVREILEPKLLGNRIGIRPLFTLLSVYIGLKLFSVAGFILGPIGLIIIITVVRMVDDKSCCAEETPEEEQEAQIDRTKEGIAEENRDKKDRNEKDKKEKNSDKKDRDEKN